MLKTNKRNLTKKKKKKEKKRKKKKKKRKFKRNARVQETLKFIQEV